MVIMVSAIVSYLAFSGYDDIEIMSAISSLDDTRLELSLDACNATLGWSIDEQSDRVVISVWDDEAPLVRLGGEDCEDHLVVVLSSTLSRRTVIDGTTGQPVDVTPSAEAGERFFPYDWAIVLEDQYLSALDAVVECMMSRDVQITASTIQALDFKYYDWEKPRDENGTMTAPAVGECNALHLEPLR